METKPEAIIFDWDNTLVDTWEILLHAMNDTLTYYNMSRLTLLQMKEKTFRSMRDVFPDIFKENWKEAAKIYRARYMIYRDEKLSLLPNALEFLELLYNETDIYLAIVSNKAGDILCEEIKLLNLEKYFIKIVGAGDAEEDKPSALPIKLALGDKKFFSHNIWYIGDTIGDMDCAFNAKCKQVFFGCDINDSVSNKYKSILTFKNYRKLIIYFKKTFK